jgi:hypothetical protein
VGRWLPHRSITFGGADSPLRRVHPLRIKIITLATLAQHPDRDPKPAHHCELGPPAPPTFPVFPAQVAVYGPGDPIVYEGTAAYGPDGVLNIQVPIPIAPPAGTPIQIVVYGPANPIVSEGTAQLPSPDGSFGVNLFPTVPVPPGP